VDLNGSAAEHVLITHAFCYPQNHCSGIKQLILKRVIEPQKSLGCSFLRIFCSIHRTHLKVMSVAGKPTHRLSFEEVPSENGSVSGVKKGTDADAADMSRMGKKQVLRVCAQVHS
jgi:hypothetical protein